MLLELCQLKQWIEDKEMEVQIDAGAVDFIMCKPPEKNEWYINAQTRGQWRSRGTRRVRTCVPSNNSVYVWMLSVSVGLWCGNVTASTVPNSHSDLKMVLGRTLRQRTQMKLPVLWTLHFQPPRNPGGISSSKTAVRRRGRVRMPCTLPSCRHTCTSTLQMTPCDAS